MATLVPLQNEPPIQLHPDISAAQTTSFINDNFRKTADANKAIVDTLNSYISTNTFNIFSSGSVTLTTSGGSPRYASASVTHNLGYSPLILGSVKLPAGLSSEIISFPGIYSIHDGTVFRTRVTLNYFAANLNSALLQVSEDVAIGDYIVEYYILVQSGPS